MPHQILYYTNLYNSRLGLQNVVCHGIHILRIAHGLSSIFLKQVFACIQHALSLWAFCDHLWQLQGCDFFGQIVSFAMCLVRVLSLFLHVHGINKEITFV